MYNILKTADCRATRIKYGARGPRSAIHVQDVCRVQFMPDSLSSVWGNSVHFAKYLMLRFSNGYSCHGCPILTDLYREYGNQGQYRILLVLAIC